MRLSANAAVVVAMEEERSSKTTSTGGSPPALARRNRAAANRLFVAVAASGCFSAWKSAFLEPLDRQIADDAEILSNPAPAGRLIFFQGAVGLALAGSST